MSSTGERCGLKVLKLFIKFPPPVSCTCRSSVIYERVLMLICFGFFLGTQYWLHSAKGRKDISNCKFDKHLYYMYKNICNNSIVIRKLINSAVYHFDALKRPSSTARLTSTFGPETTPCSYDNDARDVCYIGSGNISRQYCLTICQYEKQMLHPSNLHY